MGAHYSNEMTLVHFASTSSMIAAQMGSVVVSVADPARAEGGAKKFFREIGYGV